MEFLLGIIILALDIWALLNVWQAPNSTVSKILWTIGIIVLPVIGFIVWFLVGPKGRTAIA